MIPIDSVFMINQDRQVDANLLEELEKHNYSKVPVYSKDRRNVVGFIKLKKLLVFKGSPDKKLKDSNVVQPISKLNENMTLLDAVDQLKAKNINFAMVYDENNTKATGMITLKKIFELLVLREFLDDDNQAQYIWQQPGEHLEGREQD